MERHPPHEGIDVDEEERRWKRDLSESLQHLCSQQVLLQGYEWACRRCLHKNWVGIDALSREFECAVCGRAIAAPVDRPWQFRLNEFVHRAIRDHGIGPLIWALSVLQNQSRSAPMYFIGPTSLYFSVESYDASRVDAELDLLVVRGTEVVLVEAKNSLRKLRPGQVIAPSRRIRPNRVIIAVMENASAPMRARVQSIREALSDLPTAVELVTLDEWPLSDDPWLPGVAGRGTFRLSLM
jgi:hypothetical protein